MPNLWVRSQNKQRLSKVDDIYYVADGDFWSIRTNRSALDYAGLYPTEERCLEIIDEIQSLLVRGGTIDDKISALFGGTKAEFIVYEMPKE